MDIDDLVVMSGNTGVRLRGTITGGDESAGIRLSGRVRDLSADFLKKLWPPIVVPKSRKWVTDNVQAGRITEGAFNVDIPVNGLAEATRRRCCPMKPSISSFPWPMSLRPISSHCHHCLRLQAMRVCRATVLN